MRVKIKNKSFVYSIAFHLVAVGLVFSSFKFASEAEAKTLPEEVAIEISFMQPEVPKPQPQPEPVVRKQISKTPVVKTEVAEQPKQQETIVEKLEEYTPPQVVQNAGQAAEKNYKSEVYAWLEHHKHYPRAAKISHIEGKAILSFKVDEKGNVLEYKITSSAGNDALDAAVIKMIEDANPLPAPQNYALSNLDFSVPVSFKLN